jgi:hypothetical protein
VSGLTGSVVFVCVLWHRNKSSEAAQGRTILNYIIWTPQQIKAAEPPTALFLIQHNIPQFADIQCCVLKG